MGKLRGHLSYANVMASIAVFIVLGGTAYAVTALPRNSVGSNQIRPKAVGASELRSNAVRSGNIKNRAIGLRDIASGARRSLRGQPGPVGPQGPAGPAGITLSAAVSSGGGVRSGSGGRIGFHGGGTGQYDILFDRDLRGCYATASISRVPGGFVEDPDAGEIVTATTDQGVIVRTRNSSGTATDLPFHLIVVC